MIVRCAERQQVDPPAGIWTAGPDNAIQTSGAYVAPSDPGREDCRQLTPDETEAIAWA